MPSEAATPPPRRCRRVLATWLFWISLVLLLVAGFVSERAQLANYSAWPSSSHSTTTVTTCRVAITNDEPHHWETLESIATLLPVQNLQAAAAQRRRNAAACANATHWIFDTHVPQRPYERFQSWARYYQTTLQGTSVVTTTTLTHPAEDRNAFGSNETSNTTTASAVTSTRTFGRLVLWRKKQVQKHQLERHAARRYDVTVQASCYCRDHHLQRLQHDAGYVCIFHHSCAGSFQPYQALWLTPYHQPHYYLPTALPQFDKRLDAVWQRRYLNGSGVPQICAVGSARRRSWWLLRHYLDRHANHTRRSSHSANQTVDTRFVVFSEGPFPADLLPYQRWVRMLSIEDYKEFHWRVAVECDAMALLVTPARQDGYFGSRQKLSGAIPLVAAYRLPAVIHNQLYPAVYRDDLPTTRRVWQRRSNASGSSTAAAASQDEYEIVTASVPYETHAGEDADSFADAMERLLLQL